MTGTESMPEPVAAPESELSGTSWRLVIIQSMDDSSDVPMDPNDYTLEFSADGQVSMKADCNRGTGTFTSESAGQVTFGPIAATRALCPPDSISEKYLGQFEWVRSYVMRDGNLHLATMADGSIIEFEPLPPVVAKVLGEDVRAASADEAQGSILTRLLDDYAASNSLAATEDEVAAYVANMEAQMMADGGDEGLSEADAAEAAKINRMMGNDVISQWKVNRALFEEYGGRVVYQQMGPEPLDAYRDFLKARQSAGDFEILDDATESAFWDYFTNDSKHDFMDEAAAEAAFATPPWNS